MKQKESFKDTIKENKNDYISLMLLVKNILT